ncbi:MAG: hypothetical protein EXS35_00050 [Pedosphaera sp.]|nr:hypothetical protein [Pedosphaera sp.]
MNNDQGAAVAAAGIGIGLLVILVFLCIGLVLHILFSFCFKRICEKCGIKPGLLIWIPFFNFIRLLQAAKLSGWLIIPSIIPPVGLVIGIIMWVKVCEARGKSAALVIGLILLPIIFIPYLAFSE